MKQVIKSCVLTAIGAGVLATAACHPPTGVSPSQAFNQRYFVKGVDANSLKLEILDRLSIPCEPESRWETEYYTTSCVVAHEDYDGNIRYQTTLCTKSREVKRTYREVGRRYSISGSFEYCERANPSLCTTKEFSTSTYSRPENLFAYNFDMSSKARIVVGEEVKAVDGVSSVNTGNGSMTFNFDAMYARVQDGYEVSINTQSSLFDGVPAELASQIRTVNGAKFKLGCGSRAGVRISARETLSTRK